MFKQTDSNLPGCTGAECESFRILNFPPFLSCSVNCSSIFFKSNFVCFLCVCVTIVCIYGKFFRDIVKRRHREIFCISPFIYLICIHRNNLTFTFDSFKYLTIQFNVILIELSWLSYYLMLSYNLLSIDVYFIFSVVVVYIYKYFTMI